MLTNPTTDAKGSKSVLVKTKGHETLRITVILSVPVDGRKLTFIILKRKNILKAKIVSGIMFKCTEKGWMTE
jgi:hypothetical protein